MQYNLTCKSTFRVLTQTEEMNYTKIQNKQKINNQFCNKQIVIFLSYKFLLNYNKNYLNKYLKLQNNQQRFYKTNN